MSYLGVHLGFPHAEYEYHREIWQAPPVSLPELGRPKPLEVGEFSVRCQQIEPQKRNGGKTLTLRSALARGDFSSVYAEGPPHFLSLVDFLSRIGARRGFFAGADLEAGMILRFDEARWRPSSEAWTTISSRWGLSSSPWPLDERRLRDNLTFFLKGDLELLLG